jgi:GalNAc5-diNAcBac-PP-undecaprenol beta-1,3-glucosyltransferase
VLPGLARGGQRGAMTLATVIVPTHDHGPMLLRSVRSALEQTVRDLEIFIIGDGVPDLTRDIVAELMHDPRVRFFDRPKGPRVGEHYRHAILAEAHGEIVCYLSDDDLWLPQHVETLARLLERADFAHSVPVQVEPGGVLASLTIDLALPRYRELILSGINRIPLSTAGHSLAMYRRLPHGWRTTPAGIATDLYMWQQFLADPHCQGLSGMRPTAIGFPSPPRRDWPTDQRLAEMDRWIEKLATPDFLPSVLETVAHERAAAEVDLQGLLHERTIWAERSAAEVVTRDTTIRELQAQLAEQAAWAQSSAAEVAERDAMITELQTKLTERTTWAERSAAEVASRDATIRGLQAQLARQSSWGKRSAVEVAERDKIIRDLQARIDEQSQSERG